MNTTFATALLAVWAVGATACLTLPELEGCSAPGQLCSSGEVCVDGQCVADTSEQPCTVGAQRACIDSCQGTQTCQTDGTWGACVTCEQGQACQGGMCVCNATSCPSGCCSGGTCMPGNAASACGKGGAACQQCDGLCEPTQQKCVQCTSDSQCSGTTPRCDTTTGTCVCNKTEPSEFSCTDGTDNDCDDLTDCADPDCNGASCGVNGRACGGGTCACPGGQMQETSCNDGKDNDCDGLTDCADPQCSGSICNATGQVCMGTTCGCGSTDPETTCGDGKDNDCDGKADCADSDCNGLYCAAHGKTCGNGTCLCPRGQTTETGCYDGVDNDCDGLLDCADSDCLDQLCRPASTHVGSCDVAEKCNSNGVCPYDDGNIERCYDGNPYTCSSCVSQNSQWTCNTTTSPYPCTP